MNHHIKQKKVNIKAEKSMDTKEAESVPLVHSLGLVEHSWERDELLPGPKHPTK
jgi:hypothetical protein